MLVKKLRMKPLKKTNLGVAYAVLILAPLGDQSGHGSGYIWPLKSPIWVWLRLYLTHKESNLGVAQAIFDP